jgi:hypothetical protein
MSFDSGLVIGIVGFKRPFLIELKYAAFTVNGITENIEGTLPLKATSPGGKLVNRPITKSSKPLCQ